MVIAETSTGISSATRPMTPDKWDTRLRRYGLADSPDTAVNRKRTKNKMQGRWSALSQSLEDRTTIAWLQTSEGW